MLHTPTEVITRRLLKYRGGGGSLNGAGVGVGETTGGGVLSNYDTQLLEHLKTRDGRLLYAMYGPTPLIECVWCSVGEPMSYLYYMIPKIAWPHLLHTAVLGLATSGVGTFGRGIGYSGGGGGGGEREKNGEFMRQSQD